MYARVVKNEKPPNWWVERHGPRGGGNREGATHVAHCDDICSYFKHWCKVLSTVANFDAKSVTEVIHANISNSYHYEKPKLLSVVIPSASVGIQPINNRHSEGNNYLIPTNLVTSNQLDLSLTYRHIRVKRDSVPTEKSCRPPEFSVAAPHSAHVAPQDDDNLLIETVHSTLTTHNSLKKVALTLAEVLITLGIIGIVAAITIPTIISNYKKQVTVSRLQKAYSTINNAFKSSEVANEASEFWDDPFEVGSQPYFEKYFKPYLNGATQCFSYQECGYTGNPPYKFLDGSAFQTSMSSDALKKYRFAFYIPDGTFYWFLTASGDQESLSSSSIVYIDINGGKDPNIIGKDVFIFQRVSGKGILPYGNTADVSRINSVCKESGSFCAAKIMQDGWKITYPY